MFKDKSIGSNGRYKSLDDNLFIEMVRIYTNSSVEVQAFLRERVFKSDDGRHLNDDNKQGLYNIITALPNKPLVKYLDDQLEVLYNKKLGESTERDRDLVEIYRGLLDYIVDGDNYEWLVWNIVWNVVNFRYNNPKDIVRFNVYKQLYRQFSLGDIISESMDKRFNEATP